MWPYGHPQGQSESWSRGLWWPGPVCQHDHTRPGAPVTQTRKPLPPWGGRRHRPRNWGCRWVPAEPRAGAQEEAGAPRESQAGPVITSRLPKTSASPAPRRLSKAPGRPPLPRSTDQLQLAPFLAPPRTPFSGRTDREFRTPCPLFPKCVPTHRAEPSLGQGTSARHPLAQSPSSPHQRDERGQRRKPHRGRSKPGDPRHGDSRPPLAAGCLYSLSAGPRTPGEGQGQ